MSPRARIAVTAAFAVLFLVTASLLLLFTSGYRYDWKKHRIEKTGIIEVTTTPSGAGVLLNGVRQAETTPASFARLLPDDYRVRVEKDGELPWEKTLAVESGRTTFANPVLLRDALPELRLAAAATLAAFTADGKTAAFIAVRNGWKELHILRPTDATSVLVARFSAASSKNEALQWSPDGKELLFSNIAKNGSTALLVVAAADPKNPRTPTGLPAGPLSARWSSDGENVTAVGTMGAYAVNVTDMTVQTLDSTSGIEDAFLKGRTLYVLRRQALHGAVNLERALIGAIGVDLLGSLPAGDYRILGADGPYVLVADRGLGEIVALDAATGALVGAWSATHAAWENPDRPGRLLLWNDYEISVADVAAKTETLVTRLGTAIRGCAWHPSGEAILYATSNEIFAAELDDRDRRNVEELVRFSDVGDFAIDADDALLRFTGTVGNQRGLYDRPL